MPQGPTRNEFQRLRNFFFLWQATRDFLFGFSVLQLTGMILFFWSMAQVRRGLGVVSGYVVPRGVMLLKDLGREDVGGGS